MLLEAAVLVGDRERSALLSRRLAPVAHVVLAGSSAWSAGSPTCIALHLGAAAALLGDREQARRYYEQALQVCAKVGFRPEIALTRLQMAELCVAEEQGTGNEEQGRREALGHLDFCIPEFQEMKMAPALERALDLHERLSRG